MSRVTEYREELERKIVEFLILEMGKRDWMVSGIDDGGDEMVMPGTLTEIMDTVFSVEASTLFFRKEVGKNACTHSVDIILGNDGYDCISDFGCGSFLEWDNFIEIMEEVIDPFTDKLADEANAP